MARPNLLRMIACLLGWALFSAGGAVWAAKVSDIRNTQHNLSIGGPGTVRAVNETQVCVFCHTPHGANTSVSAPLWNRKMSGATYTPYTSTSLDAEAIQGTLDQPGGSSKLCLSCHDGTLAVGNVNVLGRQFDFTIAMTGTDVGGEIPAGNGGDSGFTRRLGVDLRNDHPISLTFDSLLANADGELRPVDPVTQQWPASGSVIGVRVPGYKPLLPLEATSISGKGQVQCGSCHDPHLRETNPAKGNQKFLRVERFQETPPSNIYDSANDIICLSCHDKNIGNGVWAYSAHGNPWVANEAYTATAASQREFPDGIPVWKASCLNCHDTHTVQGARRLLREGTDSMATPKTGGNPAIEETCYQCHSSPLQSIITDGTNPVVSPNQAPDIKTDFTTPGNKRMPLTNVEQGVTAEVHDIGFNAFDSYVDCTVTANTQCGKDFVEPRQRLGFTNPANRHAECTDCHNPHRVVKFRSLVGNLGDLSGSADPAGTHSHAAGHTNIASGVLRGMWGVEPAYGSSSFQDLPVSYAVKRGDPGGSGNTLVNASYVTREYQICLKCHSDYGYSDNNIYPIGDRPYLGFMGGTTLAGTNGLTQYTNQAKEFQAPLGHKGGPLSTADSGAGAGFSANNHRSWHPVIESTGRDAATRGNMDPTLLMAPWNAAADIGSQTMYCSDCHGSTTMPGTVEPIGGEDGNPWGPHGSSTNFILKGLWSEGVGSGTPDALCFRCHDYDQYANPAPPAAKQSGFCCGPTPGAATVNLHVREAERSLALGGNYRCSKCHVAVPHGWKNKGLLVNLNDVGPEAGLAAGTAVAARPYSQQPYYLGAWLKVNQFARSGQWTMASCGTLADMTACGSAP